MPASRKIQVFSAGCAVCEDTISLINRLACPSCEVEILDMRDVAVAKKAKSYGVESIPAVVIDGKLAECCVGRAPREESLRAAGIGNPR
jgi:hypothetical protein